MQCNLSCNTSLCCVQLLTYVSHKCTNNFQEIPYSILLMVTYTIASILAFECTFAIPTGRRLLRLLWPFMGAPVFYCLPGIIISILPPFSQGCSKKRALKKEFYCRTGLVFCRGSVITQVGNMTFYTSSVYSQKSRPRTDLCIVALT